MTKRRKARLPLDELVIKWGLGIVYVLMPVVYLATVFHFFLFVWISVRYVMGL